MPDKAYQTLIHFAKGLSAAIKERDPYTRFHSDRVMGIAVEIGEKISLPRHEITLLKTAGALHDIGKIGVPDGVLRKEGALDADERLLIQTHSERGADIVTALDHDGTDIVAQTIRHHHENFDGSGYPYGLKGEEIPLLSRIITIADNYDAMATRRVYQAEKPHHMIIDEMFKELGHKHDPALFDIFIKMIEHSKYRVQ